MSTPRPAFAVLKLTDLQKLIPDLIAKHGDTHVVMQMHGEVNGLECDVLVLAELVVETVFHGDDFRQVAIVRAKTT